MRKMSAIIIIIIIIILVLSSQTEGNLDRHRAAKRQKRA